MVLDAVLYAAPCWCSSLLACLPRMRAWYPEEWSGVDLATTLAERLVKTDGNHDQPLQPIKVLYRVEHEPLNGHVASHVA